MSARYSKPIYGHDIPWWVYDLTIAAGCSFFSWASFAWTRLAVIPLAVVLYGSFIEPRLLKIARYEVGKGERKLKLAYVSDIHVGPYKGSAWVRKLVRETHALHPDVILLGGDFLHEKAKDLPKLEPIKEFRAPLGVFAILGNHDEYRASKEAHAWISSSGIPLLENRSVRVARVDGEIAVAGADDDWYGETDLEAAFRDVPADVPLVAMIHNPDLAPHAADLLQGRSASTLLISGHTHAGQIRLPLIGPVPSLPHHLGRKYDRGIFEFGGIPLVIGAGAGESGPRARLFCRPEIVLVTMRV